VTNENNELRIVLLRTEESLRDAITRIDPHRIGDRPALKDLQEALGLVAGRRVELEEGRWDGRSITPLTGRRE
jgi:hypothetical protein